MFTDTKKCKKVARTMEREGKCPTINLQVKYSLLLFLLNFASIVLLFLPFYDFWVKIVNTHFDQCLECTAPKHRLKYTTPIQYEM